LFRDLLLAQPVAFEGQFRGPLIETIQGTLQVFHAFMVLGREGGVENLMKHCEQEMIQQFGKDSGERYSLGGCPKERGPGMF